MTAPVSGGEPEVLIIGAGPSGLTAAVVLAAHGVAARVVDPESGPTDQSRALVVQARTLELWDKLGLAAPAVAAGKPMTAVVAYSNGVALGGGRSLLPLGELGTGQTPYPFLLVFEQSKTERLLLDKLRESGGAVDWGVRAEAVTPVDGGVEVTLRRGSEQTVEHVRPRWVIGADGASSMVRHALGLGFEGGSYEQAFFLADVAVTWSQPPDALYVALTDTGTFLFVPMPTDAGQTPRYRVLGSLLPEMAAKERLDLADVQIAIDNHAGVRATVSDAKWVSLFRLHHRMAERFRVGNVFLTGDAAHIHSPVGGQGMNTGIQDAYNLAWKLALAARGHAGEALLDSYASERMPVARALLSGTDSAFNVIVSDRRLTRLTRRLAAPLLPRALRLARGRTPALFAKLSQIGISYAIGGAPPPEGGPRPGDRAPHAPFLAGEYAGESVFAVLRGPDHHLLILDRSQPHPDIPKAVAAVLAAQPIAVHAHAVSGVETLIHDAYGAVAATMVLIRPDGYVAWRGPVSDVDGLAVYLEELVSPAG